VTRFEQAGTDMESWKTAADMQFGIKRAEVLDEGLGRKERLRADGCPRKAVCMDLHGCVENSTREF
jgi:hypothetical protein